MMENKKSDIQISVILPVYQAERTLKRAVESVRSQTFEEWELIIVNDGSTDASEAIARRYSKLDTRIHLLSQTKNQGPSKCRNLGIRKAKGKYITFLDADDWISKNELKSAYRAAEKEKADIVVWGIRQEIEGMNSYARLYSAQKVLDDREEILEEISILDRDKIFSYVWNKLYLKERMEHDPFEDTMLNEDFLFNMKVFPKCRRLVVIQKAMYHYVQNAGATLSTGFKPYYFSAMKKRFEEMLNVYNHAEVSADAKNRMYNTQNKVWVSTLMRYWFPENKASLLEKIHSVSTVLNDRMVQLSARKAKPECIRDRLFQMILRCPSACQAALLTWMIYVVSARLPVLLYKIK
ncbi:MAG: glycosyltransferase family 2 protein [Clostridium sp.]|nr:glycosyltransferase family 2 protein [Clostridium sp.]